MTTDTGGRAAGDSKKAAEGIKAAARDVKHEGQRLAEEAKSEALRMADDQKGASADFLRDVSSALRKGCDDLDDHGRGGTASLVTRAADEIEGLADELADRSPGEILRDVDGFARRQPTLFFGAALLAGFGAARFLKSSASRESADVTSQEPDHGPTNRPYGGAR